MDIPQYSETGGKFCFTFSKVNEAKTFFNRLGSKKFYPNKPIIIHKDRAGNTVSVRTDGNIEELENHYLDVLDSMVDKQ